MAAPSPYFRAFKDFEHFPDAPITEEFNRLAKLRQWKEGSPTWSKQWNRFVNLEYNRLVGKRELVTLEDWQILCEQLGLEGSLPSIKQCKKAMKTIHVNIVDFLEARQMGTTPQRFETKEDLAEYTLTTKRFFNRKVVKGDRILRELLKVFD
ncbi:hypothetical protein P170DRAFT_474551 [Aspergillus steynii IBT 23096]|uniref:Uncharacterized protein n=1 Tax=Aspergillus steynii IBT 23096 TaxID=1392250 RepID=A0A2I2GDM7_9EURO|nr:uncharacterized protein P170DRAFT_474551 [Aspergillus steynii IBT 23096]PLB51004.1 hypothetical protein P170DRAFT_474551 [Aspergillus steynii IBT 23096]